MAEPTLYDRLGGAFAIAAVVDHFSDAIVQNPIVGQQSENAQLREWHTSNLGRLPGLRFMRTLWVCEVAGCTPAIRRHQTGQHLSRLGGGPPRTEDLARRVRRSRRGTRANARPLRHTRAGEGGGSGCLCRPQGRGDRGRRSRRSERRHRYLIGDLLVARGVDLIHVLARPALDHRAPTVSSSSSQSVSANR